jgi:hypothetical protein
MSSLFERRRVQQWPVLHRARPGLGVNSPSPPVLGGRGRGEGGQAPMLADYVFAWDANPPHPCPSPPEETAEKLRGEEVVM